MDRWLRYFTKEELAGFMDADSLYGKAYLICERVFDGKFDKAGKPYFNHLLAVSEKFRNEKFKVCGMLHDIIEDTEITEEDLSFIGFPSDVIEAVSIVSKKNDESYDDFINRITSSKNIMALCIKKADIEHNMDLSRFDEASEDEIRQCVFKYRPQYEKILNCLSELEEIK